MRVPDYISPVVGFRVWQWDSNGLKSLNGEVWLPQRRLSAACRASTFGRIGGPDEAANTNHDAPQTDCTCGIYAATTLYHLRSAGCERYGICGEVCLWATVVEHERGWRAQFAYPKSLYLLPDALPFTLAALQARLRSLVAYGIDIFVADSQREHSPVDEAFGHRPSRTRLHDRGRQGGITFAASGTEP